MNKLSIVWQKALDSRAFPRICRGISLSWFIFASWALWGTAHDSGPHVRRIVLNPALDVRHEVLIYYASETAPAPQEASNYARILRWLDSSKDQQATTIASQLRKDLRSFPESIDSEIQDITQGWGRSSRSIDVAIFTNRLTRAHKFLVSDSRIGRFAELPFSALQSSDYILASNMLAQRENFRAALEAVARIWPPATSTYVLITNSHGNGHMTVTPRLIVHGELTTRQQLLDVIDGKRPATWTRVGITRTGFLEEIAHLGIAEKMSFSVVLPHSCNEDPQKGGSQKFPENVGTWLDVTGSAPYDMVDYDDLFSRVRAGQDFSSALIDQMKKYEAPTHYYAAPQPPSSLFLRFAPLVLTLSIGFVLLAKGSL